MVAVRAGIEDLAVRQFDGCDLTVQHLGGKCIAPKAHPNDQWSVRLEARARTLAVSTGSVERTPWCTGHLASDRPAAVSGHSHA